MPSCFKYDCECRYNLVKGSKATTEFVEDISDESKSTVWYSIDCTQATFPPYSINPIRCNCSQFLNSHNKSITKLLGCNSNVQIGSPRCMYYVVHYTSKSTQKEDKGIDFERIRKQEMQHIQKERDRIDFNIAECRRNYGA